MKRKILALMLALLLIPSVLAAAAQVDYADSLMKDLYAVVGGNQSITLRSHVVTRGRGGYSQAIYAVPLTGNETKADLDALAVRLLKSDTKPVLGGSKHCFHGGGLSLDVEFDIAAASYAPGSYLFVCYAFGCGGGEYDHRYLPCYDRISTMAVRITKEARGLELGYALVNGQGEQSRAVKAGGDLMLDLNGGKATLALLSDVEYPVERILGIRADFGKNQAADPFDFDGKTLTPIVCGEGSITVTIGNYLNDSTRTETVFVTAPCAPMAEPTVLTEPTCTEDGLAEYRCHGHGINCETVFDEVVLPATGHTLEAVNDYLLEPTATQPGIGLGKCAVCGLEDADQEVPPIFSDVAGDSFYSEPLDYCYEMGGGTGITADTFAPGNPCIRAQVVTFLWRAAGEPEPALEESPFVDVQEGTFYYDAVLWAVENGITTGTDATHFSPAGVCNRVQVVTFLWRAFGQPQPEGTEQPFADVEAGSWYELPVLWAVENNITSGVSAAAFNPGGQCIRAQIVTFLHRAYA